MADQYDDPNAPAPLVPGQGAPKDTAPPPEQTAGIADQWRGWIGDPHNRAAMIQFGLALSQPISAGQNVGGHFGQALGQAGEASDRVTAEQQREEELASKQELRGAQADAADARAGARAAGLGTAEARLELARLKTQNQQEMGSARLGLATRSAFDRHLQAIRKANAEISRRNDLGLGTPQALLPEPTLQEYQGSTGIIGTGASSGAGVPGSGGIVDLARRAIQNGADPAAVRQRLIEQGGNPDEL